MNFVNDDAVFTTNESYAFDEFLKEREGHTTWVENEKINEVVFEALHDEPICAPAYATQYGVSVEAVEDTMNRAGLLLRTRELGQKPVGSSAIRSILDRAEIKYRGFERLNNVNRNSCASVLNLMLSPCRGKSVIKYADEKYRAVLTDSYSKISPETVNTMTKKYLNDNWQDAGFYSGYFCHSIVQSIWDLSSYQSQFMSKAGNLLNNYKPMLAVETSDTSLRAVSLIPFMKSSQGVLVPMGKGIFVPHLGKDIQRNVAGALDKVYALFQDASELLKTLENTRVNNAYYALLRVMKANAMPKREAYEAAEIFEQIHGRDVSTSALDIYFAVCDAYSLVCSREQDKTKCMDAATAVARVTHTVWETVDVPGIFSW